MTKYETLAILSAKAIKHRDAWHERALRCPKCGVRPHWPDIEHGRITFVEWMRQHPCGVQEADDA